MKPSPNKVATAAAAAVCSSTGSHTSSSYQSYISSLAQSIHEHVRVLLPIHGSGNYGESQMSAFYTIDQLPEPLVSLKQPAPNQQQTSSSTTKELKRIDIDFNGGGDVNDNNNNNNNNKSSSLAFYIDNVLTNDEADALASCAEAILEYNHHSRIAPGIRTPSGMRMNEAAHWYPPVNSTFLPNIYQRFQHLVPQTIINDHGVSLPLHDRLSEKIAQFKYTQGDEFRKHIDGLFPGQGINAKGNGVDEWMGIVSGYSILFYLNDNELDGLEGGATRLWFPTNTNKNKESYIDIQPQKGRALFFRRGSPDAILHAGLKVTGHVPKYMALINLAYGNQTGIKPMNR